MKITETHLSHLQEDYHRTCPYVLIVRPPRHAVPAAAEAHTGRKAYPTKRPSKYYETRKSEIWFFFSSNIPSTFHMLHGPNYLGWFYSSYLSCQCPMLCGIKRPNDTKGPKAERYILLTTPTKNIIKFNITCIGNVEILYAPGVKVFYFSFFSSLCRTPTWTGLRSWLKSPTYLYLPRWPRVECLTPNTPFSSSLNETYWKSLILDTASDTYCLKALRQLYMISYEAPSKCLP